jgi:histidinol-phosphate/aromatic aminotransferase/cobyric acid decarboxylase-like protein
MQRYVEEVSAARAWLVEALRALGHTVVSSPVNFILCASPIRLAFASGCATKAFWSGSQRACRNWAASFA